MFPMLFFLLTLCIRRKALGASFFMISLFVVYQPDYQIIIYQQDSNYNDFFGMLTFANINLRRKQQARQKVNDQKSFQIQKSQNASGLGLVSRSSRENSMKNKQKFLHKISGQKTNKYRTPALKKFSDIKHTSTSTTESKNHSNHYQITEFKLNDSKSQQKRENLSKILNLQNSDINTQRIKHRAKDFHEYLSKSLSMIQQMIESIHGLMGKPRQYSKKLSFGMIKSLYGKNSALSELMNLYRKLRVFEAEMRQSIQSSKTEKQPLNFENMVELLRCALELGVKIVTNYQEEVKNQSLSITIPTKNHTLPLTYYTERNMKIANKERLLKTELLTSKTQPISKFKHLKTH